MSSPSYIHRELIDIMLVVEMSPPQISSWLSRLAEDMPDDLAQPSRDLGVLEKGLAPLYDEMRTGDSLWLCQSRVMEPHGHVGIALVRDGQPVAYIRVVGQ